MPPIAPLIDLSHVLSQALDNLEPDQEIIQVDFRIEEARQIVHIINTVKADIGP